MALAMFIGFCDLEAAFLSIDFKLYSPNTIEPIK